MENTKDRENVEDVENVEPEARPTDQVPTPPEMAVKFGSFMEQCFDIAITVMETHEMMEGEGIDRQLQASIAFRLFDRCTRETSGIETMVQMALHYMGIMVQEKAAENERLAELRARTPFMPRFGGIISVEQCKHPGLKALYEQLDVIRPSLELPAGVDREKAGGADAAAAIIQAMTVKTGHEPESVEALLCPHCRSLVPLESVTSGELWSDEAEESEEEEEETEDERLGPRGRAIKAGLDKFMEDDPQVEQRHRTAGRPAEEFGKTPVDFYRLVDDLHRSGGGSVTICKRKRLTDPCEQVGKWTVEEVNRDRDFMDAVRKEHGDGLYSFSLYTAAGDEVSDFDFAIGAVEEKKKKRKKKS